MKILQLCYKLNEAVSQFDLFEEIARAFKDESDEFIFGILTGPDDAGLPKRVGCRVEHFGFSKKAIKAWNLRTLLRLVRYIRRERIDVVVTHRFKPWLLMAIAAMLLPNCRFVAVFHGLKQFDRRSRQWMARLLLSQRWRVVAVSRAVRDDLITHGISPHQIHTIHNAIDIEGIQRNQLERAEARRQLGLPEQATVIGSLGGTRIIKGHRYLVDAFAQIAPIHPNARLILLGGGDQEVALRTQAEQLGISDRTTITGTIPDGYRYLKALDLFVQPSLSEGLPIAVLEALATRLPVIGTRAGGIPEVIIESSALVPRADADALARAMAHAMAHSPEQRDALIDASYEHLLHHFTLTNYHQRYREVISESCPATEQ